jgi:thiol-disulfide isomerase/thioredoxin
MKLLKISLTLLIALTFNLTTSAQSKVKVPKELHGFWNFPVNNPGDWDGTSIGEGYVEHFYKFYYVESIQKISDDQYQLQLYLNDNDKMDLTISDLTTDSAHLQFSSWSAPRMCKRLEHPTYTKFIDIQELPSPVFKEWSNDTPGKLFFNVSKEGKVFYEDKEWDILWAAYYLDKEHRVFVKHKDQCTMIYIHRFNERFLQIANNMQIMALSPIAENKSIYKLLGNWAESETNEWKLGFFENFAIYNSDFWEYESLTIKNNKGKVVLKNGNDQLNLKLRFDSDSLCQISVNKEKGRDFFRCSRTLPPYSYPDKRAFKDTHFKKTDTVTIRGYLRHNTADNPFKVSFYNPIIDEHEEFHGNIDSLGRFFIKFPLTNTSQVYLDWGRMTKVDVIEPGETYFLMYDLASQQHLVTGDNERLHNELAAYIPYRNNHDYNGYMRINELESLPYLEYQRQEKSHQKSHLNKHLSEHPYTSERFRYYHDNNYRFTSAFHLMQRRFKLNRKEKERFPESFMSYVNDSLYQNTSLHPHSLTREYHHFLQDYIDYYGEAINTMEITYDPIQLITEFEKDGKIQLSINQKTLFDKRDSLNNVLIDLDSKKTDSLIVKKTAQEYMDIYQQIRALVNNELRHHIQNYVDTEFLKMRLARVDSVLTDSLLKELFYCNAFYGTIENKQTAFSPSTLELFQERVPNPVFQAPILKLHQHYAQLSKQDIRYIESLKKTDHLKDAQDADSLFTALTEPYRGKVIYLDIWGTWCGPCKDQMKYVGAVKEALKDENVIFMYLANNSPEESWKNIIKVNQLSGKNVVHYRLPDKQQRMIERRLSIRYFPTFILMDKEGQIVNMEAPRPQQKEQLIDAITKLL